MNTQAIIEHATGQLLLEEIGDGRRRVTARPNEPAVFMPMDSIVTTYSPELIRLIADIKGVAWVCNEIDREQSEHQVRGNLKFGLLAFLPAKEFKGKTIMDFGCGAGASTVILGQMFPESRIIGVDFLDHYLPECQARADFYNLKNVSFKSTASAGTLPEPVEAFDFIVLSAVYEHLLPEERRTIFPSLYGKYLKSGGVMFINELPYRYFPIERHTTGGLPLLNYLPKGLAFWFARHFSKGAVDTTWQDFLRNGIRGGSISEMKRLIKKAGLKAPEFLQPKFLGTRDDIELWAAMTTDRRDSKAVRFSIPLIKLFKRVTGVSMLHMLTLALRKPL